MHSKVHIEHIKAACTESLTSLLNCASFFGINCLQFAWEVLICCAVFLARDIMLLTGGVLRTRCVATRGVSDCAVGGVKK